MRRSSRARIALVAALAALLVFGVTALVGTAAPPPGKGNPHAASPAQAQYGAAGRQYGRSRVAVCHRGRTLHVPQPAARAHVRHGDRLGRC